MPLALSSWGKEELQAIQKVIDSDQYSMGPFVAKFEKNFANFFGSKFAIMVNSGSSANLLAIASLFYRKQNKLKIGDEVIVPAVSWSTTYAPLQQYGLKVKFVDVDLETLNFDLNALEKAITSETRAIFAVNLLGNPNDFIAINNMIQGKNIILLEDNCESMGAKLEGKFAGTFGLMGTFSTFFSHHMSTMEGGVVVTDDEELYHIMLSVRSHGWTRHLPKENYVTGLKADNPFEESFKFVLPGYNLRPVEMSGAIGIEQLKKVPSFVEVRRTNASAFIEEFSNHPYLIIQKEIGESSWFGFSMIVKQGAPFTREKLVGFFNENGVESRPIVSGNFANKDVVKNYFNYEIHGTLKNADYLDLNGCFIGNHHIDMRKNIHELKKFMKQL